MLTKEYELGDLLIYEQPTEYIVESTKYDDSYQTPVLTAGKSFIIGYTNETKGIYNNFPVIIFDDFTTSSQYVDFPFKVKSSAMKILSPNKELSNLKYLYYLMQTINFNSENHKRYWISEYSKLKINLPPLEEQQRIVNRIETLFAKLDEAKEKAQNVVDTFETRKASILHKAFTGELTKKWRAENGVGDDSWETVHLEDICEKIVCGKTPTGYITPQGEVPYLKVYNIVNNEIDFEITPQFIPKAINSGKLASSILKPYDVIMNIVGPPLRKIAIIPDTYPEWNMNQAIVRFRAKENLNHKYLYYGLVNPETLEPVIAETRGVVGQQNISVSQSRALELNVPTLPEQAEIVRILDVILEKETKAKEAAEAALEQIDLLKKSILARAFRGEL